MEQLYLFQEEHTVLINENGIDISKIPPLNFVSKDPRKSFKQRENKTKKTKRLPFIEENKYIAYPTGGEHPLEKYKKLGNVFPFILNTKKNKPVKVRLTRNQYPCLGLRENKSTIDFMAHEIFALAFVENLCPDILWMVDHLDEDKLNFQINNLKWKTQGDNQKKAWAIKTQRESKENPDKTLCDYMI